jgi:hypothetical protein
MRASRAIESGAHACHLLRRKYEHGGVVHVVHVIHKHVTTGTVIAGDFGKRRFFKIGSGAVGSVGDEVAAGAILGVAPDMAQVEVMADLMRGGSPFVKRRLGVAHGSECAIINHHAVG